jgi:photosystem II stability/assembly factor-like uncharacterized protein
MSLKVKITGAHHKAKRGGAQWSLLLSTIFLAFALVGGPAMGQPAEEEEQVFGPDEPDPKEQVFEPEEEGVDPDSPAVVSPLSVGHSEPPPGYANYEVVDRTIGFRDDKFSAVSMDKSGVLWVSTYEGRLYKSEDGGENWNENVVLPEVKELWGFAGQRMLLGAVRNPHVLRAKAFNLAPGAGVPVEGRSYQLLSGDVAGAGDHEEVSTSTGFSLAAEPNLMQGGGYSDPLSRFSQDAMGFGGIVLGAGLSNRAPRLSLLLTVLKRPIANISMQRLLVTTAGRNTALRDVTPHATDPNKVFAATGFGLYQSSDGGLSWYRAFAGMTPAERWIGHVATDPKNPKRVYMGTSRGLFVSDDGGDSWTKNTKVPEISIRRVAIDPTDSRYVYVAGWGGVYRSSDYGENFNFAFYHSIPRRRDVLWMAIDPFDPNVAYLGTGDGLMRTTKLRTANIADWEVVDGLRSVNLVISGVNLCTKHPGHIYMQTRADLPTLNYGANGPESLILESWDHGASWRELAGNRTAGDIQWFTMDANDPDTLWVAFSRALVQIRRVPEETEKLDLSTARLSMGKPVLPDLPSLGRVVRAALEHTELELGGFVEGLDSLRNRNWLPNRLHVTGRYGLWNLGSQVVDIQLDGDRYLNVQNHDAWNITAWLSWTLPDLVYRQDSAPLMRFQELKMINGVRERVMHTVHRSYGELQRIIVKQRHETGMSLKTRVNLALRAQYLEAIVDVSTGGFLTKWNKETKQ